MTNGPGFTDDEEGNLECVSLELLAGIVSLADIRPLIETQGAEEVLEILKDQPPFTPVEGHRLFLGTNSEHESRIIINSSIRTQPGVRGRRRQTVVAASCRWQVGSSCSRWSSHLEHGGGLGRFGNRNMAAVTHQDVQSNCSLNSVSCGSRSRQASSAFIRSCIFEVRQL